MVELNPYKSGGGIGFILLGIYFFNKGTALNDNLLFVIIGILCFALGIGIITSQK
mgnify:FL=1